LDAIPQVFLKRLQLDGQNRRGKASKDKINMYVFKQENFKQFRNEKQIAFRLGELHLTIFNWVKAQTGENSNG
jgi:hypothetical protein